jgi:hypothetical protein
MCKGNEGAGGPTPVAHVVRLWRLAVVRRVGRRLHGSAGLLRAARVASWVAVVCAACAGAPRAGETADTPILVQSERVSHWPVEGETRPGIWIRFDPVIGTASMEELMAGLRLLVEHGARTQVLTGTAFTPMVGVSDGRQTRYLYTPTAGTLFLTLELRTAWGRSYFPDTQRIELNDDCWHMVSYRVRGELPGGSPPSPPPYPRTVFLTPALSGDAPVFLEVFTSGNCFRNPLPPHE